MELTISFHETDKFRIKNLEKPRRKTIVIEVGEEEDEEEVKEPSIYDCLDAFGQEETLEGVNQYFCSRCQSFNDATKVMEIFKLPPILIIHLKRFKSQNVEGIVDMLNA